MTNPSLYIINGPAQRDLELAFVGRNLGAEVKFTVIVQDRPLVLQFKILNIGFVTCHGPNYQLGGQLSRLDREDRKHLPLFNFIFVGYNAETKQGAMEFSNAE